MYAPALTSNPQTHGVTLRLPYLEAEEPFRAMLAEVDKLGEHHHFGLFRAALTSYEKYVEILDVLRNRDDPQKRFSPIYSYLIYEHDQLAGEVRIRRRLPPETAEIGGHITMYVRPSLRRRGVGAAAFHEALNRAQQSQLITLLLAALSTNQPAVAIMQRAGGIPVRDIESPVGIFKRFRFFLQKPS